MLANITAGSLTLLRIDETTKGRLGLPVEMAGHDGGENGVRRERRRTLRVVVSDAEQVDIARRATAASLSVSAYLRTLGLGYTPKSTLDQQAIGELVVKRPFNCGWLSSR